MNILVTAAASLVAIGSISTTAIVLDQRHVSRSEYEQFAGRVEASQYATALIRMGARIDPRNRVDCRPVPRALRGNCVWLRTRFYDALRRR